VASTFSISLQVLHELIRVAHGGLDDVHVLHTRKGIHPDAIEEKLDIAFTNRLFGHRFLVPVTWGGKRRPGESGAAHRPGGGVAFSGAIPKRRS
jgi:hypothetical protein